MITFAPEQLAQAERMLGHLPGEVTKALTRAVNRAAEAARAEAIRGATARYRVKTVDVRKTLNIRKGGGNQPAAAISSTGSRIPLILFRVTPSQPTTGKRMTRPHKAAVLKGKAPEPVPGLFVARMRSGHLGAWHRTGEKTRNKKQKLLENFGPSIPEMLGHESVIRAVEARAQAILGERLEHEIEFILGSGK